MESVVLKETVFSIIIPHKNSPVLLNRCLNSIPTRSDVQIIVVDDNSDEDKKPVVSRNDVEVVLLNAHQAKWAGRARNVGIERAKGKWLLFADADDCYTDYLPNLFDKFADDKATDIVYLNVYGTNAKGKAFPLKMNSLISNYLKGKKNSELALRYGFWTPWSRMVKRDVVVGNKIRFDEYPAGNDIMFGLLASYYANKIAVEKEMVYKYFKWPNGSITDINRFSLVEEPFFLRGRVISFQRNVGYRTCLNLLSKVEESMRYRKMSAKQALLCYRKTLIENHLFWGTDLIKYCYEIVCHRMYRRISRLFVGR